MSWKNEFFGALRERDKSGKVNDELIEEYTRLADRIAALESERVLLVSSPDSVIASKNPVNSSVMSENPKQLRKDLTEAMRARGQLQSRLKLAEDNLEMLRSKNKNDTKVIRDLSSERAVLLMKVKDRDEELKGKAKLVEEVQDEMVSLNLQFNMAEQRAKELRIENKELIDRWMARMGKEADAMNDASKF